PRLDLRHLENGRHRRRYALQAPLALEPVHEVSQGGVRHWIRPQGSGGGRGSYTTEPAAAVKPAPAPLPDVNRRYGTKQGRGFRLTRYRYRYARPDRPRARSADALCRACRAHASAIL